MKCFLLVTTCILLLRAYPVLALPTIPQLQTRLAPASAGLEQTWASFRAQQASISVNGKHLPELLGPLADYKYSMTPSQLKNAMFNTNIKTRLRRVVHDLWTGRKHVKVGVIGTSVSWGTGPSKRGTTDWVSMLPVALKMVFPLANVTVRNGCFPATGSSFANMCLGHMVDSDVDLLLLEFVTNDFTSVDLFYKHPQTMAFERLVRKSLKLKERPAVVLVQVPTWGQMFNQTSQRKRRFHMSAEDMYGAIAQYYSLPVVSYRNAWWHEAEGGPASTKKLTPNGWLDLTMVDLVHPNDWGHRSILDMLIWLVHQTATDLVLLPLSLADSRLIKAPLPPPMHPGNREEQDEMCLLDEGLHTVVVREASHGWIFVNEGTEEKRKTGYVGTTPGSTLTLRLNMSSVLGPAAKLEGTEVAPKELRMVGVMLGYLQSYTNMGIVRVECTQGCACKPTMLDAHHAQKTSTTFMSLVNVEAHRPVCTLTLTIQQQTSSGGHKFKVSALMMNRKESMGLNWSDKPAQWEIQEMFTGEWGATQIDT